MEHSKSLPVPSEVRIEAGYLVFTVPGEGVGRSPGKRVSPKPMMLDDFVSMGSAAEARAKKSIASIADLQERRTNEKMLGSILDRFIADPDIVDFARRWGVLGFCPRHGQPGCPAESCSPEKLPNGYEFREPLTLWHGTILRALAMERIGESLSLGNSGSMHDWKQAIIEERNLQNHMGQPWKSRAAALQRFGELINRWLYVGNLRPRFGWHQDHWAISAAVPGGPWPLFGYLALYLALAAASERQAAYCFFCGKQYWPKRQPTPGQKNCCGESKCRQDYWRANKRAKQVKE